MSVSRVGVKKNQTKKKGGRGPHQVNTCCSSGLGNVAFGGEFGDEINVPSSNCDGRWNPPILIKARIKNGDVCSEVSLGAASHSESTRYLFTVDWCCHP